MFAFFRTTQILQNCTLIWQTQSCTLQDWTARFFSRQPVTSYRTACPYSWQSVTSYRTTRPHSRQLITQQRTTTQASSTGIQSLLTADNHSRKDCTLLRQPASHILPAVVAFSSVVRILGKCSTIHSPYALFLLFCWNGDSLVHTNSTFSARISPQWLGEVRRLWPNFPWQVACELVFGEIPTLYLDSGVITPLRFRWV